MVASRAVLLLAAAAALLAVVLPRGSLAAPAILADDAFIETYITSTAAIPLMKGPAPSFLDLSAAERGGHMCRAGFYCPVEGGVCCAGGKMCCEQSCNNDSDPPTCQLSKSGQALALAKAKMEQEAQQDVQSQVSSLEDSESGVKATEEARQKELKEQKQKMKRSKQESKQKSDDAAAEAKEKDSKAKTEQQTKAKQRTDAQATVAKKETSEQQQKQKVLVEQNLQLTQSNKVVDDADLTKGDAYTYMFWIYPIDNVGSLANVLHKGTSDADHGPAIFFIPGSTRLRVLSATQGNQNDGVETQDALPLKSWTHVVVSHKDGSISVAFNGQVVVQKNGINAPALNTGPVYMADPWNTAANAIVSDVRYQASFATDDQVKKAFDSKAYQEVKVVNPPLKAGTYVVRRNQILVPADKVKYDTEYTIMFWVQPRGLAAGWGSILHKGSVDTERNPGCWFYPGSLRLACRSGIPGNWNYADDSGQQLQMFQWTHVAICHKQGMLAIFYNGQQVINFPNAGAPLKNNGPLYSGDPWYEAHPSLMADVRIEDKFFTPDMIQKVMALKTYSNDPPAPALQIQAGVFSPTQGHVLKFAPEIEPFLSYARTYAFFIKVMGTNPGWSNIFHKGNNDGERVPACWLYPGQTRMHFRSATSRGWNDGGDAEHLLPIGQWTHVAVIHHFGLMRIYHDGQVAYEENGIPAPNWILAPIYSSNPWYPPANVVLADLRYYDIPLSQSDVQQLIRDNKPQ